MYAVVCIWDGSRMFVEVSGTLTGISRSLQMLTTVVYICVYILYIICMCIFIFHLVMSLFIHT